MDKCTLEFSRRKLTFMPLSWFVNVLHAKTFFHVPVQFNDTVKLATILASESLASIRSQCPQLSDYLNLCMGVSYQPCLPEHI